MPPTKQTDLLLRAPVFAVETIITMDNDGPMTVDITPDVLPEDQWILEGMSLIATVAIAPTGTPPHEDWKPPVSGLYLCPPNTPTDTQETASFDLNMRTRPIPVPLDPYTGFRSIISPSPGSVAVGAISMVAQQGFQVSVPGGWFLRGILITNPGGNGTDPTGPGQDSIGKLSAMVRVLRNLETFKGE